MSVRGKFYPYRFFLLAVAIIISCSASLFWFLLLTNYTFGKNSAFNRRFVIYIISCLLTTLLGLCLLSISGYLVVIYTLPDKTESISSKGSLEMDNVVVAIPHKDESQQSAPWTETQKTSILAKRLSVQKMRKSVPFIEHKISPTEVMDEDSSTSAQNKNDQLMAAIRIRKRHSEPAVMFDIPPKVSFLPPIPQEKQRNEVLAPVVEKEEFKVDHLPPIS